MSLRPLRAHALIGALALAAWGSGALEGLERGLMDARFRLLRSSDPLAVTLVAIDERSLAALEVWPWSRQLHATAIENLTRAGASRIAFDVDFGARSDPEDDAEFERGLAEARPRVVLPVFVRGAPGGLSGAGPLPAFAARAALGGIHVVAESDGSVRRYGGGGRVAGAPTFARALLGLPSDDASYWLDAAIDTAHLTTIPYVDVLTGNFDARAVSGRPVLVGATALELGDRAPLPLHASVPGPRIQALAAECEWRGRRLSRSGFTEVLATVLLAAAFAAGVLERAGWRRAVAAAAGAAAVGFGAAIAWQATAPRIVDLAPASIVLAGGLAVSVARGLDRETLAAWLASVRATRAESFAERVVASSLDAVVVTASDGRIESLNPAAATLFGEVEGRPLGEILPEAGRDGHDRTARRADGSTFAAEVVVSPIQGEARRLHVVRDVSERRALVRALEYQAGHDPLTGLANRRRLLSSLETALGSGGGAFVLVDLDRFKEINDSRGHAAGDAVLRRVARSLESAVAPGECLGRLGGDEFGVVIPRASEDAALARAAAFRGAVAVPFAVEGFDVRIDASAGVAAGGPADDPARVVARADAAMYASRRAASGPLVYRPEMDAQPARERAVLAAFDGAIAREELFLLFQPKVSAASGRVVGGEALLRWRHPELGLVPPSELVPAIEARGGIRELTRFVLERTAMASVALRERGFRGSLAANLSARNLRERDLAEFVRDLLARHALEPASLVIEVTESAFMDEPEEATRLLQDLASLGVEISVDDFGTGYSSLAYLGRLPAHEVKIDRSFVVDITRDARAERLVRGIVDMAHGLGLRVVAEGVEDEATWSRLVSMGCDQGQGYWFGRPASAESLPRLALPDDGRRPSGPREEAPEGLHEPAGAGLHQVLGVQPSLDLEKR